MKRDEKAFIRVLFVMVLSLVLISLTSIYLRINENMNFIRLGLMAITIICFVIILIITFNVIMAYRLIRNKKISNFGYKVLKNSFSIIYPSLLVIAKITNIDINIIRRVYTKINNLLVKAKNIKVGNDEILVLLPHCLQNSECKYKITNDIRNCRLCGKCDIKNIIEICDKYNVEVAVATGGTLAREWIRKKKPKAIIAVACERDLSSGINDVKKLPVLGVTNERPNGPCFNTRVNVDRLEDSIKFFLKEV